MPKVSSPDAYKVPAFQRKRSLSAKARRVAAPVTALDRMKAGVPFVKKKAVRRSVSRRSVSRRSSMIEMERRPISGDYDGGYEPVSKSYDRDYDNGYSNREASSAFSQPLLSDDSYGEVMSRDSLDRDSVSSDSGLKEMRICGKVSGYLEKIEVAIVDVSASMRAGDRVIFESENGLFEQTVESMQIDRQDVVTAYSGDCIGMKVLAEPKKNGSVYKVV